LQREYRFLAKKYGLHPVSMPVHFLRMRPMNFPTVRLAQLAAFIQQSGSFLSAALEAASLKEIRKKLEVTANDYWHYHYRLDEPSAFKKKKLGGPMADHILINTIVPAVFAYGWHHGEAHLRQKAIRWLEELGPESNAITRGFEDLGVTVQHACDSQALVELKTAYCDHKRCLHCAIGGAILKIT
jgi:hypothetical protein